MTKVITLLSPFYSVLSAIGELGLTGSRVEFGISG